MVAIVNLDVGSSARGSPAGRSLARTTNDWPRRASPHANTPGTVVWWSGPAFTLPRSSGAGRNPLAGLAHLPARHQSISRSGRRRQAEQRRWPRGGIRAASAWGEPRAEGRDGRGSVNDNNREADRVRPAGQRARARGGRSEERRVGKEGRSRWAPYH